MSAFGVLACFPPGDGVPPPEQSLYFPAGLAMSEDGESLFAVNSDFDLQFNQGVVQTFDLQRLNEFVPTPCSTDADCGAEQRCDTRPSGENDGVPAYVCVDVSGPAAGDPCGRLRQATPSERVIAPGRCAAIDVASPPSGPSLITDSVQISAFATDVLYRVRPAGAAAGARARLFIPVRGDTTLHWIDVTADGRLLCGQHNAEGKCDDEHRVGDDPEAENTRDLRLPAEPFGLAATDDGRAIVVTHQTQGAVSLFVNDWIVPPRLEFVETDLPTRPMEAAAVPVPAIAELGDVSYEQGFLVTFRDAARVHLLRFFDDGAFSGSTSPARPYLVNVGASSIPTNTVGTDSRGIAVDDSNRDAAERACTDRTDEDVEAECQAEPNCPGIDDTASDACLERCIELSRRSCLEQAAAVPLDVYVANRTPPSLILGRTRPEITATGSSDFPRFYRSIPLTAGPSRVVIGDIVNPEGQRERRVFVLCFDSRLIFIYDPVRDNVESEIFTGRGPHSFAVDAERNVAYVGHFTDSYIGVVSLDQRHPRTYGSMIATIGVPTPPRASK